MSYKNFYLFHLIDLKGSGEQKRGVCPFCKHPEDFSVNVETGQFKCFYSGCAVEGDVFDFLMKLKNLTFPEAKKKLEKYEIYPLRDDPSPHKKESKKEKPSLPDYQIRGYCKALTGEGLKFLRDVRGLSGEVIDKYRLGYYKTKKRFAIPVIQGDRCVNIRLYSPDKEPKILPISSGRSIQLYPEEQLQNKEVWLCEGEFDSLCGISHGLNCITVTGGAGSWRDEFTSFFEGKKINIVYDCDPGGRKGAERVADLLSRVAEIKVIDLRLGEGEDLTDWFVIYGKSKEELLELIRKTPVYKEKKKEKEKKKKERIYITGRQLIEEPIQELEAPIGNGFFVPERYTILAASDGEGKTTFCIQLALSAITGTTFLDFFPIPKPVKVLYFCGENSRGDIKAKVEFQKTEIEKILKRRIIEDLEKNLIIVEPININFLLSQGDKEQIYGWIEDHKPNIVIFDPLADFISSLNSISDDRLARGTVKLLTELAQTFKCFPLLTTHFKKEAINPVTGRSIVTLDNAWDMVHGSKYWLNSAASQIVIIRTNLQRYPKAKKIGFKFKTVTEVKPRQVLRNENLWYEELPPDEMDRAKLTPKDVKAVLIRRFKGKALPSIVEDVAHKELDCTQRQIRDLVKLGKEQGLFWKNKVGQVEVTSLAEKKKLFDD